MVGWWVEPDRKEKRGNASKGRKARVGMMLAGMAWGGGGAGWLAGCFNNDVDHNWPVL